MTTTVTPATNGRQRRSLEDQLNRLDSILDGLADALNEAVADAVKDAVGLAVREAVKAVMTEVVANPAIAAKMAEAYGLEREPKAESTWKERFTARLRRMRNAVVGAKNRIVIKVVGAVRLLRSGLESVARLAGANRRSSAFAIGLGLLVGLSCSLCGVEVASTVSGLAVIAGAFMWRMLAPLVPLWKMLSANVATASG